MPLKYESLPDICNSEIPLREKEVATRDVYLKLRDARCTKVLEHKYYKFSGYFPDAFQMAFMKFFNNYCTGKFKGDYREEKVVEAYFCTILERTMLRALPKVKEPSSHESDENPELSYDTLEAIFGEFSILNEDCGQLMAMRNDGLSFEEISEATGRAVGVLGVQYHRCKCKLQCFVSDRPDLLDAAGMEKYAAFVKKRKYIADEILTLIGAVYGKKWKFHQPCRVQKELLEKILADEGNDSDAEYLAARSALQSYFTANPTFLKYFELGC